MNKKLADELEEFLKTGKEEDEYGSPTSPKQKTLDPPARTKDDDEYPRKPGAFLGAT